jgi:hypothetical protein
LLVLALVLAASACGTEADMMLAMDPGTGGSASSPDTMPGTGGAVAHGTGGSAAGTGGMQATGGVSGTGGSVAGTGGSAGETPPPLPFCPVAAGSSVSPCDRLGPPVAGGYSTIPRWKDGRECSTCMNAAKKPQTGCLAARPVDPLDGSKRDPAICVLSCGECCFRQAGVVCSSDADCCSPMRCKPGTVGTNKTCQ